MTQAPAVPAKVLLVEDDEDVRFMVSLRLQRAGYQVFEAADGRQALRRMRGSAVDVVLLDLGLPVLDGFGVLERMGGLRARPPVIILSARADVQDRVAGLREGAVDYLVKPFEPQELLARIEVALRQKRDLERVSARSRVDPLTGLGNRIVFEECFSREMRRAGQGGRPPALVYLDADRLKRVNDTHGHEAGDDFLRAVARALGRSCRRRDCAARIGGDEFAVLLAASGRAGAEQFTARLERELRRECFEVGGARIIPEVSWGFAVLGEDADDAQSLRGAADRALYDSKRRSREAGDHPEHFY